MAGNWTNEKIEDLLEPHEGVHPFWHYKVVLYTETIRLILPCVLNIW